MNKKQNKQRFALVSKILTSLLTNERSFVIASSDAGCGWLDIDIREKDMTQVRCTFSTTSGLVKLEGVVYGSMLEVITAVDQCLKASFNAYIKQEVINSRKEE